MAGPFVFRLEAVRRLRQRAFEEAQRVVANRLRAIGRERAMIEAARAQTREQLDASRVVLAGGVLDLTAVRGYRAVAMLLARRIAESEGRVGEHERALAAERAAMVRASVAVKALEKLKERRRMRFDEDVRRREGAEESEMAIGMHRRGWSGKVGTWEGEKVER